MTEFDRRSAVHCPDRLRELLRELDDPEHLELPRDHDLPAARERFDQLAAALERRFGSSVTAGRAQDASFHGFVTVPATATGADRAPWRTTRFPKRFRRRWRPSPATRTKKRKKHHPRPGTTGTSRYM
ncbi:hypothetical protein [Streptomyces sp. NPDC050164]|uniref:hypothetical protein n=1 Tax=Streptomyces sp. NPDC050164 TaxID=3365605 RepID=UPI0037BBBB59